ncbi:MAG: endonuclease MutS2 [Acidobacteria bacterium]|nr:MAG: endonuclease MutS2 [Acidobacteriota bacterium]
MPPHWSERLLEFDRLREILLTYCGSDLGRQRVTSLHPLTDVNWIRRQHQLTEEVLQFLQRGGTFEFHGLTDNRELLKKSGIAGAALETADLQEVLRLADRADEWRAIALKPPAALEEGWPAVRALSERLADFTLLLRFFRGKILPDGTLDDHASPELARLRREVEKQKREIQTSLRNYLRRLAEDGAVQDELVTIRGERFVIPVKADQKRRVNGVVHGASSSGQTVFVEPLETIEQNNELVRLMEEENAEIHRILLEMTARIAEHAEALAAALDVLSEVELQFAKARFARDYQCVRPNMNVDAGASPAILADARRRVAESSTGPTSSPLATEHPAEGGRIHVRLLNARHPVLEHNLKLRDAQVVPMSLSLAGNDRQLIISGPNTGGKTVALKTVGLIGLMAQSGIPMPAESAELPVFDGVFADIGDYQSIEQNLSTFSAHVSNIDFISKTATGRSLVLLDELGSATDPEEGAALAVAIAKHFLDMGATSIISTHHTALKVYATNTPGVVNAAVGFDEKTLQPTYELKVGVPGASAGINIAQRLGLNTQIIAAARHRLAGQTQDIAHFLDQLHQQLDTIEHERGELRKREQEVARERSHLESEGLQEQRRQVRELEKKLENLLRDFEYQAREAVNAVQERTAAQKLSKDAERRITRLRREFQEQFNSTIVAHRTGADRGDPNARPGEVKHIAEGDTVRLKSLGRDAVVKRKVDENTFEVEAGIMKMRVPRSDIANIVKSATMEKTETPVAAARARGISVSLKHEDDDLSLPGEINVIGQTVDDATREVEKFVDRAFLAGMTRVRIVHGSGMGILRKALRQFLKSHPHVAMVTEPPQSEGGAGATVVELRV